MLIAEMKIISIGILALALATSCATGPAAPTTQVSSTPSPAVASPSPPPCPASIDEAAEAQHGACLEAAVLGPDVVAACSGSLAARGWVRDPDAESLIGGQTGKKLTCYRAP